MNKSIVVLLAVLMLGIMGMGCMPAGFYKATSVESKLDTIIGQQQDIINKLSEGFLKSPYFDTSYDIYFNSPDFLHDSLCFVIKPSAHIVKDDSETVYTVRLVNHSSGHILVQPHMIFSSGSSKYIEIKAMDLCLSSENAYIKHKGKVTSVFEELNFKDGDWSIMRFGENAGGVDTIVRMWGIGDIEDGFLIEPKSVRDFQFVISNIDSTELTDWDMTIIWWARWCGQIKRSGE